MSKRALKMSMLDIVGNVCSPKFIFKKLPPLNRSTCFEHVRLLHFISNKLANTCAKLMKTINF